MADSPPADLLRTHSAMPPVALTSLAPVIRSKNAGPTQLTIDLFFHAD